ncbi:MAG TPA: phytanoyl-CoA dioxygenase family protein [Pseudomonadales bacterium]
MGGLQRFSNTTDHETLMQALNRDGGLIVEDLFASDVIKRMGDAVKRKAKASRPGSASPHDSWQAFHGRNTIRFTGLGLIDPAFFEMLANPILGLMADEALQGRQWGQYWLNTGQTMIIGPGEPAQFLHRDCSNWTPYCKPLWPHCPEITLSAMIALDDMTEELGGTRVIPGSHLWEDYNRPGSPEETVATEMRAGSGMIYSGKVIHGGGANRTHDRWRFAMHISFVVGWLVPEEASALYYPLALIKTLPPRTQRLLGHRSYVPAPRTSGRLWLKDFDEVVIDA